jgi:hypothetical protein
MKCSSCKANTELEFKTVSHEGRDYQAVLCMHCKVIITVLHPLDDSSQRGAPIATRKKDYSVAE